MQDPAVTMGIKSIDVLVWIMTLHLFSSVKVNSQEFPYVSFMGNIFTNHSYLNASLLGSSESNSVQCHTNVGTCCTSAQGRFRGDWFHPNGSRLGFSFNGGDIYQTREAQRVDLFRRNNANANGIFFCNISVHVESVGIYVGLYTNGGQFYVLGFTIFMLGTLYYSQEVSPYKITLCLMRTLTSMEPVLSSPSPVSPLVDLLPTSLGPETLTLSLKELRLC